MTPWRFATSHNLYFSEPLMNWVVHFYQVGIHFLEARGGVLTMTLSFLSNFPTQIFCTPEYISIPIPLYLGAIQKKPQVQRSCIKTSPDRTVRQRSAHPCKPESSSFDSNRQHKTHALGNNKRHTGIGGYGLLRTWPGARRTTNSLSHWTYNLSVRPWSDTRTDSD